MPSLAFSDVQHTTTAATLTSASFTPLTGDIIVVKVVTEGGSTYVPGAPSGGGWTYTSRVADSTGTNCWAGVWTAPVTAGGTAQTVAVAKASGAATHASMVVELWRNAQLATTPATCDARGTGAPSTPLTTVAAGSVVSWASGDFAAVSPASRTYNTTSATPTEDGLDDESGGGFYVAYYAYQTAASAGAQTLGLTAPTGQTWTLVGIEIQDVPVAAAAAAGRPAQPGRTWLRRFHHRQQLPQFGAAAAVAGLAGNQPGGLVARRSARQYSRAVTGSSVTADGNAGPPPAPVVVVAAAPLQQPVIGRRYPPRAVFRGVAAPPRQPLLLPRPPPSAVAARPLVQRPRALVAFRPVATSNAVPPRGAPPGGLVRRRGPARAVVAFRPVATVNAAGPAGTVQPRATVGLPRRYPSRVFWDSAAGPANAHGPAGARPGTGLVRARPAGQIHRVVWAGTTVRTVNNVVVPRGTVPPRPAVARRAVARAVVAFTPVRTVNSARPTVTGGLIKRRAPARAFAAFTPVATVNASGPAGSAQPRAAVPVPRRAAARGLWQRVIGPANAHGPSGAQPGAGLVRRRSAARAFVAFRPVRTVNNTIIPPGTVQPKPVVARRAPARAFIAFRPVRTTNAPPTVSAPVTGGLITRRHPKQVSRSRLGVGIGGAGVGAAPRAAQPVTGGVIARRHPKQVSRARTGLGIGGAGVDAAARLAQPATGTGLVRRRYPARAVVAFRPVRTVNAVPPRGSVQPKPVVARRYPARAYVAFRPVRTTAPLFTIGTLTTQTAVAAPAAATTTGTQLTAATAAAGATATATAAGNATETAPVQDETLAEMFNEAGGQIGA